MSSTSPTEPTSVVSPETKIEPPVGARVNRQSELMLTNRQKVAVLLAQLGTQRAGPILKEMSDEEAISLIKEMIALPALSDDVVVDVLSEFMHRASQTGLVGHGGAQLAQEFLEERLGQARAREILEQIEGQQAVSPLSQLLQADPQKALEILGAQQPQVVAVILAYLPPADAAALFSGLSPAFRVKVAKKIAQLTRVDPAAVRQATTLLVGRLRNLRASGSTTMAGGAMAIAEILNHADRSIEQQVLGEIEAQDQNLAEQIRAKLFTFDDVIKLEDKALQQIFRKLEAPTLALAMKDPNLSPEALSKIRSNLSERVTIMIEEEMEVMGAVRSSHINAAQGTIVQIARQLDEEGTITIARDDEVVI